VHPLASPLDLEEILESVRETAYRWDFATDRIDWAANAETVLGIADMAELGKGRAFALRVDPSRQVPAMTGSPAARMSPLAPSFATACTIASFPKGAAAVPRCGSRTPASAPSMRIRGRPRRKARSG
jgi:hypothetical protein